MAADDGAMVHPGAPTRAGSRADGRARWTGQRAGSDTGGVRLNYNVPFNVDDNVVGRCGRETPSDASE